MTTVIGVSDICQKYSNPHTATLLTPGLKSGVRNGVLAAEFSGGYPGFGLAENTDDLLVGKTLLHVAYEDITYIGVY